MMLSPDCSGVSGLGCGLPRRVPSPAARITTCLATDDSLLARRLRTIPPTLPAVRVPTVSTTPTRVFAARLAGLPVFDPQGDPVGKVRDVVVVMRPGASSLVSQPRVVGLVVEVFGRRQIFAPMTRITSIDAGQVITTGLL